MESGIDEEEEDDERGDHQHRLQLARRSAGRSGAAGSSKYIILTMRR